ncbi:MAG: hypothetical protein O2948_11415 [Proteobacteria bacterium]|jgi:hypothetical protein|nr:hypothetical protein [Pseudomonadota bacterium]
MKKTVLFTSAAVIAAAATFTTVNSQQNEMSFFITSVGSGDGANLGGLAGADAHCQQLAEAAGSRGKTWNAYLSAHASGNTPAVDARDRIGFGPWYNANGVEVASTINNLHSPGNNLNKQTALTENGATVNGRGDDPNQHDILTGSTLDGREVEDGSNHTCSNWTSNGSGTANVGHFDRTGGGQNPTSWNAAHGSRGCSQSDLVATGGNGYFYCFAID